MVAAKQHQGPGPIKLAQLPPAQQQHIMQASQAQQAQQLAAGQQLPQQPSPIQQQQLSPNVAPPPRRSPAAGTGLPGPATTAPPPTSAPSQSVVNGGGPNEHNIFIELQRLQKEKERLQREQEEIARKVGRRGITYRRGGGQGTRSGRWGS